jgi:hypothetical protein
MIDGWAWSVPWPWSLWALYDYRSDTVYRVNTVECFWKMFNNSIRSADIHVSQK